MNSKHDQISRVSLEPIQESPQPGDLADPSTFRLPMKECRGQTAGAPDSSLPEVFMARSNLYSDDKIYYRPELRIVTRFRQTLTATRFPTDSPFTGACRVELPNESRTLLNTHRAHFPRVSHNEGPYGYIETFKSRSAMTDEGRYQSGNPFV
ncbi:hypothetical protein RRG08_049635 [Elysia crispata]|uniref:Uncharacterized protein n=1 Tax=Elysia crispata TaxID=231223 RepID=A0AAE1E761_9GAST|nr:hypothetical protein RRG08_049635 [Elysia crispata]